MHYFFTYVITEYPTRVLKSFVVEGTKESIEATRAFVISGAQVKDLRFVSEIFPTSGTHQDRERQREQDNEDEDLPENTKFLGGSESLG